MLFGGVVFGFRVCMVAFACRVYIVTLAVARAYGGPIVFGVRGPSILGGRAVDVVVVVCDYLASWFGCAHMRLIAVFVDLTFCVFRFVVEPGLFGAVCCLDCFQISRSWASLPCVGEGGEKQEQALPLRLSPRACFLPVQ